MLKKIFEIIAKVVGGIAVFYLLLGFVIIPLLAVVVIPWQGSKVLKTPVKVRSVFINPVFLTVHVNGLQVLDHQKNLLAGFEHFGADVSFLALLKKVYRVESVDLTGLRVNAELLPGNRINLMDLVPAEAAEPKASQDVPAKQSPLPRAVVDKITMHDGAIHFTDKTVSPEFATTLGAMALEVTGISTEPDSQTKVNFTARLDDRGTVGLEAMVSPFKTPMAFESNFKMSDYAMRVLTPYVGKYTGRSLKDGKLDLKLDCRVADHKILASHKLLIQHFEFGQKVQSKDALPLPFGLAVALLEDSSGRISVPLSVSGDLNDPKFEYWQAVGQVVRNFFLKLVTSPFSALASVVGFNGEAGTDELGYVKFTPGRADLSDAEKQKLAALAKSLKERPKLRLEVRGSYDKDVDWKAMQADIFSRDYEALKKETSRPETIVYQLLYQQRFGVRALWALSKKYKLSMGEYHDVKLNQEIKRQLIENAPPDQSALNVLGQARAQVVYDFFLAQGFDPMRMELVSNSQPCQSTMGHIPMEFTLTVFGEQVDEGEEKEGVAPFKDSPEGSPINHGQ